MKMTIGYRKYVETEITIPEKFKPIFGKCEEECETKKDQKLFREMQKYIYSFTSNESYDTISIDKRG